MKFHTFSNENMFYGLLKKMTSCDTDDVIPGKIGSLTHTAKSDVNIIGFLSTFQNIFVLVRVFAV